MNTANYTLFSGPPQFIVTSNPLILVLLYRYGLGFIFILGFTGNLASVITFLRPILRATSTGFLFLILALSDSVFLLASIFDFIEVGLIEGPILLAYYGGLCRMRWFLKGFIQFCSAWILVIITIDRWVRTRFPFKTNKWCTRRNALIAVVSIVITSTCLHGHILSALLFGGWLPGIATSACGPLKLFISYTLFYFHQWPYIQVFFVCLFPVALMLIGAINIHHMVRKAKRRIQSTGANQPQKLRQERLQRQMLLLMLSSITIFFVTTLPVSLSQIVGAYQISIGSTDFSGIVKNTSILTVLLSLNYAINFYIHCLASKLFREEFIQCMKVIRRAGRRIMLGSTAGNSRTMVAPNNNEIALVNLHRNQSRI